MKKSILLSILAFHLSSVFGLQAAIPPVCQAAVSITGGSAVSNDTIFACVNTPLTIKDVSLIDGLLSDRDWDFGDGLFELDAILSPTTTHSYEQQGVYTLVLTVSSVLCAPMIVEKTIVVLGVPIFNVVETPISCFGECNGAFTIDFLTPNAEFYSFTWIPTQQSGQTISDLCSGDYSADYVDDFGCIELSSIGNVTLQEPELLVSSFDLGDTLNLCPANGTTDLNLTITGGVGEYLVNWPSSSDLVVVGLGQAQFNPTQSSLDQMYTVEVFDDHGCATTDSIFLRSTPSFLQGSVSVGGAPCQNCKVIQLHHETVNGLWPEIAITYTTNDGNYDFGLIGNFVDLALMVDPDPIIYPIVAAGYYPSSHSWSGALPIVDVCGANLDKHITLLEPMNFNGSNTFSGTVFQSSGPGKMEAEEDPIPLIDVVVEKTPPGQAQGRVSTNEQGQYQFDFVPNSDTTYTLYVNLPGVPVMTTYEILVDMGNEFFGNLDFCVNEDTTEINICQTQEPVVTGDQPESNSENILLYPNPSNGIFTIETRKFARSNSQILITDLTGRLIFAKQYDATPYSINMVNLAAGYYVVKLSNDIRSESASISVLR